MVYFRKSILLAVFCCLVNCFAVSQQPGAAYYQYVPADIKRQEASVGGLSGLNTVLNSGSGSGFLPILISGLLPLLLLGGLLSVPFLGLSLFRGNVVRAFTEANPTFLEGLNDIFDRVTKALDNVSKKYIQRA
ncbi:uncharacterized protein LOC143243966 [Tachypleus tridentatus]|uniref:uncharacterized protein LOC143243966 n=1 Tax=Tachypleus tridentatus TaxID=6853 RepID=UPI003FD0B2E1